MNGQTLPAGSPGPATLEDWLRSVPFFRGMAPEDLGAIAAAGSTTRVPANRIVFNEGDPADRLYVILAGRVRIFKADHQGHELTLAWPGPGEFFGEMALLDGGLRSAGVAAVEECRFFTLGRDAFLGTLSRHPELLGRVMTELTSKIRESGERSLREEMEAHRLRSEAELQRHRALSRVVAGVAHELNTPLGIARTAASVLQDRLTAVAATAGGGPDPVPGTVDAMEEIAEAVELLDRNIVRAHRLVQDFKAVSVGQVTDVREPLDLSEVVTEVVGLYRIQARKAGLEVRVEDELAPGARRWVGYRGYLTQVLLNFLGNVERYAYPDGTGGPVEIRITGDDDAFTIRVRDQGAGIPAADLPRVFEPFYTTGRGRGGTGLGLAIVHNIVTAALEGTVALESEPGRGTTAVVTFPRVAPESGVAA